MEFKSKFSFWALKIALSGISVLLLLGCDFVPGLGPERDNSKFSSALLSKDM